MVQTVLRSGAGTDTRTSPEHVPARRERWIFRRLRPPVSASAPSATAETALPADPSGRRADVVPRRICQRHEAPRLLLFSPSPSANAAHSRECGSLKNVSSAPARPAAVSPISSPPAASCNLVGQDVGGDREDLLPPLGERQRRAGEFHKSLAHRRHRQRRAPPVAPSARDLRHRNADRPAQGRRKPPAPACPGSPDQRPWPAARGQPGRVTPRCPNAVEVRATIVRIPCKGTRATDALEAKSSPNRCD